MRVVDDRQVCAELCAAGRRPDDPDPVLQFRLPQRRIVTLREAFLQCRVDRRFVPGDGGDHRIHRIAGVSGDQCRVQLIVGASAVLNGPSLVHGVLDVGGHAHRHRVGEVPA